MANSTQIKLSPNSLNLYFECPFCFWIEKRHGVKRPQGFLYSLNLAVDELLKKEFDEYRSRGEKHPLLLENNIDAKLFPEQDLLDEWRDNKKGIRYFKKDINAVLIGAPDDIIEFANHKIAPLDYKSTGVSVPKVYDRFQLQMDTYTFLLEKNGYPTPKKGYLAFYIIDKKSGFDGRLPFRKELHEISTDPSYIEKIFKEAVLFLQEDVPSAHSSDCQFGKWLENTSRFKYQ